MSEQSCSRLRAVLLEAEQITEFAGCSVPVGTLQNGEEHGAVVVVFLNEVAFRKSSPRAGLQVSLKTAS